MCAYIETVVNYIVLSLKNLYLSRIYNEALTVKIQQGAFELRELVLSRRKPGFYYKIKRLSS